VQFFTPEAISQNGIPLFSRLKPPANLPVMKRKRLNQVQFGGGLAANLRKVARRMAMIDGKVGQI
jgi:hypothetical protein